MIIILLTGDILARLISALQQIFSITSKSAELKNRFRLIDAKSL